MKTSVTQPESWANFCGPKPNLAFYSERSVSTAFTLAARAAGTADAITAAASSTTADAMKASAPGSCTPGNVFADGACEREGKHYSGGDSNTGDDQALQQNIGEDVARLSAQSHADAELARAPAHGKRKHPGHAHHGDQ